MQEGYGSREAYQAYSDEQLIERLREYKEDGITDYLIDKYKYLVRKKANVMFLIGGDTDDLIQEGMIGLFKAIRDYNATRESSFYHFAEICIARQIYTAVEASTRKKHAPLNSYISLSEDMHEDSGEKMLDVIAALDGSNPEQMMIDQENLTQIQKKIDKRLSRMEKEVLNHYMQGMGYIQIAEIMAKTPKSIDNALQRIKNKLSEDESNK